MTAPQDVPTTPAAVLPTAPGSDQLDGSPEERDWVSVLSAPGPDRDQALRDLHGLLLRAARHQVQRMRFTLAGAGPQLCEDIANSAADEALTALLGKLSSFEGRSRFTTWAYKFAILHAATEMRRQAWAGREVALEDVDTWGDRSPGPELEAEASELAAAVAQAMSQVLTAYQRRIAVSLLVDGVPIDVLADRLGTTRGALYKTLHVARGRLRAHLISEGFLPAPGRQLSDGADS